MRKILWLAILKLMSLTLASQSIGIGTTSPDNSALLDISSTDKGLLVPRMTAIQRAAIVQPATGLIVYQTNGSPGFYYNTGTPLAPSWLLLLNSASAITSVTASSPLSSSGGNTPNLNLAGNSGGILYGTGTGSSFTGTGTSGYFLRSNGSASPYWSLLGQSGQSLYGSGGFTLDNSSSLFFIIPGLQQTITVPENSVVYIATDGGLQIQSTSTTAFSVTDIAIFIDGALPVNTSQQRIIISNTSSFTLQLAYWSMSQIVTLTAGSHNIIVGAASAGGVSGSSVTVSGITGSVIQGKLSVIILKQ